MNTPPIQCPACRASVLEGVFNVPEMVPCPACNVRLQIEVFPAFFRPAATAREAESILLEGESSCFYHPQKKAVLPCEACGRFLCALCDCDVAGRHFCPSCLEAGRTKRKIKGLENRRTLYDGVALSVALYPMLFFYFTLISAPIALFVAIRHWKTPLSIVPRTKIRYVVAIILATFQIFAWALALYFFINRNSHG